MCGLPEPWDFFGPWPESPAAFLKSEECAAFEEEADFRMPDMEAAPGLVLTSNLKLEVTCCCTGTPGWWLLLLCCWDETETPEATPRSWLLALGRAEGASLYAHQLISFHSKTLLGAFVFGEREFRKRYDFTILHELWSLRVPDTKPVLESKGFSAFLSTLSTRISIRLVIGVIRGHIARNQLK